MERILVVDDDEMVRTILKSTLERDYYEVDTAVDGAEALKMFQETRYDLVITDILMPEKEGLETILGMRGLDPNVRVLAISGGGRTANYDYLEVAQKMGAQATLRKPFKPEQFLDKVRITLADEVVQL